MPSCGLYSGIVHISLATLVADKLREKPVAVAYLRMGLPSAADLTNALDLAHAMAAPVAEGKAN